MGTETTTRGIVASLRMAGVIAAVAAGIAGVAAVPGEATTTEVAVVAERAHSSQLRGMPVKACAQLAAHAPMKVVVRRGCVVIGDTGPIDGAPIFR